MRSRTGCGRKRIGVTAAADVTVPADGAEWIRNLADEVFLRAAGVLDFYHVAEAIADAVTAVREPGARGRTVRARSVGGIDGRHGGAGAVDRGGVFGVAGGERRGTVAGSGGVCGPAPRAPG